MKKLLKLVSSFETCHFYQLSINRTIFHAPALSFTKSCNSCEICDTKMFPFLLVVQILGVSCLENATDEPEAGFNFLKCTRWLTTDGSKCESAGLEFSLAEKRQFHRSLARENSQKDLKCCDNNTVCFSKEAGGSFECNHELPACMAEIKPAFLLYTPRNRQTVSFTYSQRIGWRAVVYEFPFLAKMCSG